VTGHTEILTQRPVERKMRGGSHGKACRSDGSWTSHLVPLLVARPSSWRTVVVAACVSLGIEVTQLATAHLLGGGHLADVDDLVFKVVGGAVGYVVLAALARAPRAAAPVDRFRRTRRSVSRFARPRVPATW
jgi:hypothetical protein